MSIRLLGVSILLIIILGCSHSQVTDMPHFTMDEQKACGRQCLAIHSRCTSACGDMFSGADTEKRLQKCRHNCNSVLGDCYGTCK